MFFWGEGVRGFSLLKFSVIFFVIVTVFDQIFLSPSKRQIFKVGGRISHLHHTPLIAKSNLPPQSPVYDIKNI